MHPINPEEQAAIASNPVLRLIFGHAKRWYDSAYWSLLSTTVKSCGLLILVIITFILFTDVGWADAIKQWGPDWQMVLLMARAGGAPNGAHLLSYIPLPLLGGWVAWKFRKDDPGNSYLGAVYLGIMIVGFGLATHELIWLAFYWLQYYGVEHLAIGTNVMEDLYFLLMCAFLIYSLWKYPFRKIPLRIFVWPLVSYAAITAVWWLALGLPITTVNNYQIGTGIYEITKWWADPTVNAIEIFTWVYVAVSFWLAIWWHGRHHS